MISLVLNENDALNVQSNLEISDNDDLSRTVSIKKFQDDKQLLMFFKFLQT